MKQCSKCKIEKSFTEFHRDSAQPQGLSYSCKSCTKLKNKKNYNKIKDTEEYKVSRKEYKNLYYKKNREFVLEKCKEYRQLNKAKKLESDKKWRIKNPKKVYLYSKKYVENNRGIYRASWAKRRAAKLNATLPGFDVELKEIYKKCPKGYHVDHIIPLQSKEVCGLHVPWNLQYLSPKENLIKSNKIMREVA